MGLTLPGGGGGGITSIDTGNTLWVDALNGNDGTAVADRQDLPWLTITPALAAASSGDVVRIRSGTYTPAATLTIPTGVAVVGDDFLTTIIDGSGLAAHVVTLSADTYLRGLRIDVPTAAGFAGVTHSAGTASIYDLDLRGNGVAGLGDGVLKTGAGKIVGSNIRCDGGGLGAVCRVDSGTLALDAVHVPPSAGTIADVILVEGTGRFQGQGINIGASATDCLHIEGTGTALIYSPNWANAAIGGHIAADGVTVIISGGKVDATVATLLVDPALTGVGTTITVVGTDIQPLFSFPSAALGAMDLSAQFHQNETTTRSSASRVVGQDLLLGFPEIGSGLMVGEGSAYSDGIKVVTSDGTATSTTLGGNLTDVTVAAGSTSGSTVTFQGLAADHCIYVASARTPVAGGSMKHWGLLAQQVVAGVGGSYVAEIWDGAAWVAVGTMSSSIAEVHRYANTLFIRAASTEMIQYGIDTTTTWATVAVDGVTTYWLRFRVATLLTTLPTFERLWLAPSHTMVSALGRRRAVGLALWRATLISAGNIFGESGNVVAYDQAVGLGGVPTGWTHNSPNSLMNGDGDAVYTQFALPAGICTAFPLKLKVIFAFDPGGTLTVPVIGFVSAIPIETAFNSVADPTGGLVPVPRAIADTETTTAKAGTAITFTSSDFGTVWPADTLFKGTFGPYDISSYYADDAIFVRLELDDDGTPAQDVGIVALIVEGVQFTDGGTL